MEIIWTGLQQYRVRRWKLMGRSSLWMFPIYGAASFLRPIMKKLQGKSIWKRGTIYMIFIYLMEYISGTLLKRHDACPWDYSRAKYNLKGVIRADYAPLWFLVGLMFEKILLPAKETS